MIWENITLVINFNLLHNDFEMITASLLHSGDKNFEKIQQIVTFTKVANLAKQAFRATIDLAMIAKKKQLKKYSTRPKTGEENLNYRKKGHYTRDGHCDTESSNKEKPKELSKEAKRAW